MKKLMSMVLGLSLTIGSAAIAFAQDKQPPPPTKEGQNKGDKKGKDDKGDKKGKDDKGDKKGKDDKGKN